ncbi:MAG TPA: ATP-binding protein [Anaerolineae bacterium]|nr:ATP-binding protein [Anaerolineae bacterium]
MIQNSEFMHLRQKLVDRPVVAHDLVAIKTDLERLTIESTLADLPTHSYRVGGHVLGHRVAQMFADEPQLPGVIVIQKGVVRGVFSRRTFLEQIGRPYGVEVYLNRPIEVMLRTVEPKVLQLPSSCSVYEAAQLVLQRPSDKMQEPVLILFPEKEPALLDVYVLLLAQSQLLNLVVTAEQRRRQLAESFQKIGKTLSSSLSLGKVTERILKELSKVMMYERGMVMLYERGMLRSVAQRGFPEDDRAGDLRIEVDEEADPLFRQIISAQVPLLIGDVMFEPNWRQLPWLPVDRSWLGVPLIIQKRVIGLISLTRRATYAFDEGDIDVVLTFAGQAAIALENASLYNQIISFNEQLEEMVTKRTAELNQAYTILEKLDQTKSDFIRVSAHELRTPLTVMKGYGQMLSYHPTIQADDSLGEMTANILAGIERLYRVVNNILDVAKIDSNTLDLLPRAVAVKDVITQLAGTLVADLAERRLDLVVEDLSKLPLVVGDFDLLTKLFYSLLSNGMKYTPDGGQIRVGGEVWVGAEGEGYVQIMVEDTGIGIGVEQQGLIFEKFYQTGQLALHSSGQTKFKGGGPGLGLAIARGIVEAHQGEIWVESEGYDEERCPGSRFYVRLPVASEG